MGDPNVDAADRHFDHVEEGARQQHILRLIEIGRRIDAIKSERNALKIEERKLRAAICTMLGVSVGDVIDTGRRHYPIGKILSMRGEIDTVDDPASELSFVDPNTALRIARVVCECAPETSPGKFHAVHRLLGVHVWDDADCKFRYRDADDPYDGVGADPDAVPDWEMQTQGRVP